MTRVTFYCLVSRPICQTEWQRGSGYGINTGQDVWTSTGTYDQISAVLISDSATSVCYFNVEKTPWRHSSPTATCMGAYITSTFLPYMLATSQPEGQYGLRLDCCVSNSCGKQGWCVRIYATFCATSSENVNVHQYTRKGYSRELAMSLILLYL